MQDVDDLISMLFHVIGFVKKHHDKVPRSVLKFYAYLNNNVKSREFKEDKFHRLYKSCKVTLLDLVKDKKLIFDNEIKEQEWFAKMDDLEGRIYEKQSNISEEDRRLIDESLGESSAFNATTGSSGMVIIETILENRGYFKDKLKNADLIDIGAGGF